MSLTTLSTTNRSSASRDSLGAAKAAPARRVVPGLPAALLGLSGAGIVCYGVTRPWLSTFAGLLSQSGSGTRNGDILIGFALVAALLSVAQLFVAPVALRWLLGLVGFVSTAFAGYLVVELYVVTRQLDGMLLGERGAGLYIVVGGAAVVFSTLFVPMPGQSGQPARGSLAPARTWALRPIRSWLRFPTAALAATAGLAHVPVTPQHLDEAPYIGYLFMALTVVCVVSAAVLLVADSAAAYAFVGLSCLLAVLAYVISRTVGLPLMGDDVGNWFETLGVVSVLSESALVGCATWVVGRACRRSERV